MWYFEAGGVEGVDCIIYKITIFYYLYIFQNTADRKKQLKVEAADLVAKIASNKATMTQAVYETILAGKVSDRPLWWFRTSENLIFSHVIPKFAVFY